MSLIPLERVPYQTSLEIRKITNVYVETDVYIKKTQIKPKSVHNLTSQYGCQETS